MFSIRITTWGHVFFYALAATLLSVAVPVSVVLFVLWDYPLQIKALPLTIAGLIPPFIAFPIAVFALNLFRNVSRITDILDELVRTDTMTGLFNRSHFLRQVEERRTENALFVIADADRFKSINDKHGHEAGDMALTHLAQTLTKVIGPHGIVGRLGGEEFGIYLPEMDLARARLLFAALSTALHANPLQYDNNTISTSLSAGFAIDKRGMTLAELTRQADKALYVAKAAGRDCGFVAKGIDEIVPLAA